MQVELIITSLLGGLAGLLSAGTGVYIARRKSSGNVRTSDADAVFDHMKAELKRMRDEFAEERRLEQDERKLEQEVRAALRSELIESEKRERACVEQQRRTELELHALRTEVAILRGKVAAFEMQGIALAESKIKFAALEAAMQLKAEAVAASEALKAEALPKEPSHVIIDGATEPVPVAVVEPTDS